MVHYLAMEQPVQLLIGTVVKSHGIKGEVVVRPTTDEPDLRFAKNEVLQGKQAGKEVSLTIATVRWHQGRLLVRFAEIADRNQADTLRGMQFFAAPLEDPEDDGFYDHELIGLKVQVEGETIGVVADVLHQSAQDLLVVMLQPEEREVLIPFVHAIVPEVDLAQGLLVCTPPAGLLEL